MSSVDSLTVRALTATPTATTVVDDTPVAIRISHPGTEAVTSVTVTTATNIVLIDADGTDTLLYSTYTTIGLLADKINSLTNWSCKVLDALRTDATDGSEFVTGAITLAVINGETVWDMLSDTSVLKSMTYRCTNDRNVDINRPKGGHRVRLQEVVYNLDVNGALANGFQIWKWDASAKTETQIYRKASVDAAETTVNFASGEGSISGGVGNDIVVRVTDSTSLTDATANFLECVYIRE